jgi:dienelactone hydrolase
MRTTLPLVVIVSLTAADVLAQDRSLRELPALDAYFESRVADIEAASELTQFKSAKDWKDAAPRLRAELFDMLGLSPLPEETPLAATVTGTTDGGEIVVERLHFQSLPGLYVTGNLYRPKDAEGRLPAILYLCGHGAVKKDGVSFGNKVHYQHHGAWFARNGYVCLTIDSLQLGEIEAIHHGTYREGRWWWNSRGYTPAGVEAWNCIRALDYLESRRDVDPARLGATGRSGGGAYSWWIAALDERIACAVPVAGITSLRDHVVEGCVEGHCDCMYMLNTFQWDYAKVAALVAPRPLLISNTDKDPIFPLEGVYDIHRQVRHIYRLLDAGDKLGLQITEGPHEDTQELHIHAFRWFNRFLKNDLSPVRDVAEPLFEPEQLTVFAALPSDEINTRIDEVFVPAAERPDRPRLLDPRSDLLPQVTKQLRDRSFRAWPDDAEDFSAHDSLVPKETGSRLQFVSEPGVDLMMEIVHDANEELESLKSLTLHVTAATTAPDLWSDRTLDQAGAAYFSPRGCGMQTWPVDDRKQIQIRRRFQLIGTTLEAQQVLDIRAAIRAVQRQCPNLEVLSIHADEEAGSLVLLACLFESNVSMVLIPEIAPEIERQPSILNLTRTVPFELIPVLVAARTTITTATPREKCSMLSGLVDAREWQGRPVWFGLPEGDVAPPKDRDR